MPRSICRSIAECTERISWTLDWELSSKFLTTALKRTSRVNACDGREREEMLKEDLEGNFGSFFNIQNRFFRNRETYVDPLPCCKQRVEEQRCWRTASNSVRLATDLLQDTEQSQCRRRRRWSNDKEPENKMQKGER